MKNFALSFRIDSRIDQEGCQEVSVKQGYMRREMVRRQLRIPGDVWEYPILSCHTLQFSYDRFYLKGEDDTEFEEKVSVLRIEKPILWLKLSVLFQNLIKYDNLLQQGNEELPLHLSYEEEHLSFNNKQLTKLIHLLQKGQEQKLIRNFCKVKG
jgi:hypothetical protein